MNATAVRQYRPLFEAKPRISSTGATGIATTDASSKVRFASKHSISLRITSPRIDVFFLPSQQPRVDLNRGEKEGDTAPDPAAFRARLKHRAPTPTSTTTTTSGTGPVMTTYDNVLDTARRVAELEHQRAQDALYIRTLEQTRATLIRDAQSAARARGEAARAVEGEHEARRGRDEAEAVRDEAVRRERAERERAERAEERVRALEGALGVAGVRVRELEVEVEGERRRREELESGLEEALASGSSA